MLQMNVILQKITIEEFLRGVADAKVYFNDTQNKALKLKVDMKNPDCAEEILARIRQHVRKAHGPSIQETPFDVVNVMIKDEEENEKRINKFFMSIASRLSARNSNEAFNFIQTLSSIKKQKLEFPQ
jgi:hypothetical protein